jgi:hypothetical protein
MDKKEQLEDGFTEVQVEMPEELYQKALAAAREEGCTLDEWVAELLREEIRRRAKDATGTPENLTTDNTDGHGSVDVAAMPPLDDGREVGK